MIHIEKQFSLANSRDAPGSRVKASETKILNVCYV